MGNHHFAIEDFNESIKERPTLDAYFYRGISKLMSKDYTQAEIDFNKALEFEGAENWGGIYDGLGWCFHAIEEYERALDYFDKAI